MAQDNNAQVSNLFLSKFDTVKSISNKRAPTAKPMTINPHMKSSKQTSIFLEHGINYENPVPATVIAQARYDRIQMERKKLLAAQQAAAQGVTSTPPTAPTAVSPSSTVVTVVSSGEGITKVRTALSNSTGIVPLVIGCAPPHQISTGSTFSNQNVVQHRQLITTKPSQLHQHVQIMQQKQLLAAQQQQQFQQQGTFATLGTKVQVTSASNSPSQATSVAQAPTMSSLRAQAGTKAQPRLTHQQVHASPQTQTVVLATGLGALGTGSPVSTATASSMSLASSSSIAASTASRISQALAPQSPISQKISTTQVCTIF